MANRNPLTRAQFLLSYLLLTAAIATGLALFSSATTVINLVQTATADVLLPLLLALIVTFLLEPLVTFIEREHISRTTSIFVVYLLVIGLPMLGWSWFFPPWPVMWESLHTDIPRYTASLTAALKDLQANLQAQLPFLAAYDLPQRATKWAERLLADILVGAPKSAFRLGSLLMLVPLFTFFFLRDGHRLLRACIALAPNRYFEMAHDLSYLVSRQLAQFIRGRIIEALIVGLVVSVGLSFTDIRYAPLLGLFAGVTNLIPYIGPLVGMIPGILIALVDLGMGGQFWWIVTVYFLIAQVLVDNFILIPVLISRVSNLHPLWVFLAIIMGGKLYGVLGMIIGVPVASIIKIVILEIRHYRRAFALPDAAIESDRLP
jgi:putative permease